MAKTIHIRKNSFGKLEPADRQSEETISGLPLHKILKAEIRQPRNVQHHRKLFALLGLVLVNQEYFKTTDALLYALKMRLGYVVPVQIKGLVGYMPESISFSKMDQLEFNEFYSKAVDFIIEDVIPGMDRQDLINEVEGF